MVIVADAASVCTDASCVGHVLVATFFSSDGIKR
jgi:hypothetical protein